MGEEEETDCLSPPVAAAACSRCLFSLESVSRTADVTDDSARPPPEAAFSMPDNGRCRCSCWGGGGAAGGGSVEVCERGCGGGGLKLCGGG